MGDSGIHGQKGLTSPSKPGAALGVWSDLTVFAVRGGQTVLALGDLGQQGWASGGSQTTTLADPANDILVARMRPISPLPMEAGQTGESSNKRINPAPALSPNAANAGQTQPPSDALAMLEFAFGLGNLASGDALLDDATAAESETGAVNTQAPTSHSTPTEAPLDPLSDAACALSFDAALKAALAADAAAMAAELAAANAAGVPPHGSAQAALHDESSHPLFST
jgi:hypothetical protein